MQRTQSSLLAAFRRTPEAATSVRWHAHRGAIRNDDAEVKLKSSEACLSIMEEILEKRRWRVTKCMCCKTSGLMLYLHVVLLLVVLKYASAFAGFVVQYLQLQTCTSSKPCGAGAVQLRASAADAEPRKIPAVSVKKRSSTRKRSGQSASSITATNKRQLQSGNQQGIAAAAAALAAAKPKRKIKIYTAKSLQQLHLTQLLQLLGKQGRWREVLPAIDAAQKSGLPLNAPICNSGISALARSGRWRLALELLDSMQERGVQPTVISFNAAINACAKVRATAVRILHCSCTCHYY
jgi:pentatricopeptide repeat protein